MEFMTDGVTFKFTLDQALHRLACAHGAAGERLLARYSGVRGDWHLRRGCCASPNSNDFTRLLLTARTGLQARLREQAHRGYQWLVQQDRQSVVQRALRPFLSEGSIWSRLTGSEHRRDAHVLQNEGAALLEGGVYGGEVIMACHAATACGADIVLADREKALSNARLLAARQAERLHRLQHMPDGALPALSTYCYPSAIAYSALSTRRAAQTTGRWCGLRRAWRRSAWRSICGRSLPPSPPRTRRRLQSTCTPSSSWRRCPRTSACSRRWAATRGAWWAHCNGSCEAAAARAARRGPLLAPCARC